MAKKGDQEEVRDAVVRVGELLHEKENAGYTLGEGDLQAVEFLKAVATAHRDFVNRMAALSALARLKETQAESVFIESLGDDHWGVRLEAARALTDHPTAKASSPLTRQLDAETESEVRLYLIKALVEVGDRVALKVLLDVFLNPDVKYEHHKLRAYGGIRKISGLEYAFEDTEAWEDFQAKEYPQPPRPTAPRPAVPGGGSGEEEGS